MKRTVVATTNAPQAIGPYSQGICVGNMVFASGQLGMDPQTGVLKEGVEEQTHQALKNVMGILEAAGTSIENVVKTTVFLNDIKDFTTVNEIYSQYFKEPYPARSAVEVAQLPKSAQVEIEVIAVLPE